MGDYTGRKAKRSNYTLENKFKKPDTDDICSSFFFRCLKLRPLQQVLPIGSPLPSAGSDWAVVGGDQNSAKTKVNIFIMK